MDEVVKAGKQAGTRLYNEYGSELAPDAVRLALRDLGMKVVESGDVEREVQEKVQAALHDSDVAEWEAKRRRTFRHFHQVLAGLFAVIGLQAVLVVAGIWTGDWRWSWTALALLVADLGLGFWCGYLWDRIPENDSKPVRRSRGYY